VAKKRSVKIYLSTEQYKILSEFFSDLAKGLILGAIIGQGFILKLTGFIRVTSSIFWVLGGCLFLFFALYFAKEVKSDF